MIKSAGREISNTTSLLKNIVHDTKISETEIK